LRRKKCQYLGFLLLLVIAAICGAIAQAIVGYSLGGCVVSTVLGAIGAYIGYWIATAFGLPLFWTVNIDGTQFPIIWSILGAIIFVAIVSLFSRRRVRY
jgi:uncharacterized membrane protein YeaQ/YmgE (transglycosylase-associated protein family)